MRRKDDCRDNAVAERFFGSLKGERPSLRHYASRQEAWEDVIDYIERFYTSTRLHSYWGDVSPHDFERLARVAYLGVRFYLTITISSRNKGGPALVEQGRPDPD
jgi:transposase InsO family protein